MRHFHSGRGFDFISSFAIVQEAQAGAECEWENGAGPFTRPEVVPKALRKILSHFTAAWICRKKE